MGAYGFGICFVHYLKPSPLGDLGFDIDKKYCDAELCHQNMSWLLKLLDNENVVSMRFVEKNYFTPQGVP